MILKFFIEIIAFLAVNVFQLIYGVVPNFDFVTPLMEHLDEIITICSQSCNFLYFIVGDSAVILIPLVFGIFYTKLIIAPLLRFVIGFVHWGG